MAYEAPGKHFRKGMSLIEIMRMFPDDKNGGGMVCRDTMAVRFLPAPSAVPVTSCWARRTRRSRSVAGTAASVSASAQGPSCEPPISDTRHGQLRSTFTLTSLKGVSSMKLHRDLDITQKSAWHLAHRIRKALESGSQGFFTGPVEVDETYFGGKRANMPKHKREQLKGRGAVGKTAVVGAKDRAKNLVSATVVQDTKKPTLHGFVSENTAPDATVYTDDALVYESLPFHHEVVRHSVGEYVKGMAHTNGMESFWSMLKRA